MYHACANYRNDAQTKTTAPIMDIFKDSTAICATLLDVPLGLLSAVTGADVPLGAAGVAADGLGSLNMAASGEFAGIFRISAHISIAQITHII